MYYNIFYKYIYNYNLYIIYLLNKMIINVKLLPKKNSLYYKNNNNTFFLKKYWKSLMNNYKINKKKKKLKIII